MGNILAIESWLVFNKTPGVPTYSKPDKNGFELIIKDKIRSNMRCE